MRLDETPVKKKKSVKINSPSNPMENLPEKKKVVKPKAITGGGFRGNARTGKTLDDFKKAKADRDKKKKVVARTKPKDKTPTKKPPKKIPPKKKKNVKKPKKDNVVKTTPTPKPRTYDALNIVANQDQSQEILNAYLALAGTELFQYTNSQTIDGMYNDVAIINVLSRRRQAYTPNRLIELAQIYIKHIWVQDGYLCVDVDDPNGVWDQCVLSFTIGSNIEVAYTVA
jgi:hypothetical protein